MQQNPRVGVPRSGIRLGRPTKYSNQVPADPRVVQQLPDEETRGEHIGSDGRIAPGHHLRAGARRDRRDPRVRQPSGRVNESGHALQADHHRLRRNGAVHEPDRMCGGQAAENPPAHAQSLLRSQRVFGDDRVQRGALDPLLDQPQVVAVQHGFVSRGQVGDLQ